MSEAVWTVRAARKAIRASTTKKVFVYVALAPKLVRPTRISKAAALLLFPKWLEDDREVSTVSWIDEPTMLAIGDGNQ